MKAYKIELFIIDYDECGVDEIKFVLENARYPNRCICPEVMNLSACDIGEWDDDHPLNKTATYKEEYKKLIFKLA